MTTEDTMGTANTEKARRDDPQIAQISADSILICENLRNLRIYPFSMLSADHPFSL
jgi:hypothetical protein